ncbi:hypothetical protein C8R47DRAFT_1084827 [Mycena vitilis]|nr:hypothetical protein C8R47DRAFT_1084827 [Mycena vitilis]
MTFTNIGVCPYLSPLVLVSSVGLAKQRAEATAFPMVRRPSAEGIAQSSPGCVGVETETHFAHAERDRKPSMRSAEQREKAQKSGQGITQNGDSDDAPPYPGAPIPTAERLFEATRAPWTGDYRRYIPQHREPGTGCLCTKYVYPFLLLTWVAITSQPTLGTPIGATEKGH